MTRSHQFSSFATVACLTTLALIAIFMMSTFAANTAQAQTFTVLHEFTGGLDGANPSAGLTLAPTGRLFGTSSGSTPDTSGAAFTVTDSQSNWLLNPLYRFVQFGHGLYPNTRLIFGPDGSIYGTTWKGGAGACAGQGCGVVFKLQPPATLACRLAFCPWTETVLYTFAGGADGSLPGPLTFDAAGNIYGNTYYGGTADCQCGTVYELKFSGGHWSKTILHSFSVSDGADPDGPVVLDRAGNLYGTAITGGSSNTGVVYELSPSGESWTETILHNFQGSEGYYPNGGLIADSSGNLYGVASEGGSIGLGTVFRLTQPGTWTLETLYSFTSYASGGSPHGPLAFDGGGNLYGVADFGLFSRGTIFGLTLANKTWIPFDLHDFNGSDGIYVNPGLVVDNAGNIYGTSFGDTKIDACYPTGCGNIWQITP